MKNSFPIAPPLPALPDPFRTAARARRALFAAALAAYAPFAFAQSGPGFAPGPESGGGGATATPTPAPAGSNDEACLNGPMEARAAPCAELIASGRLQGKALAAAYYARGGGYYAAKQFALALADFNQAIALDPGSPAYFNDRGLAFRDTGDLTRALADFDQAIALNANYALGRINRSYVLVKLKRVAEAVPEAERAAELDPSSYAILYYAAYAEIAAENWVKALGYADRMILASPRADAAHEFRGRANFELEHYDAAIADMSTAISINPKNAVAFHYRGRAYTELGRFDSAIADFDASSALDPKDPIDVYRRAEAKRRKGAIPAALIDYNTAIAMEQRPLFYLGRATAYETLGQIDQTIAEAGQALRLSPEYAAAWTTRANAYNRLGKFELAEADARRAIELAPRVARSHVILGVSLMRRQLELYQRLCRNNRPTSRSTGTIGPGGMQICAMGPDFAEAVAAFEKGAALDPKYVDSYFRLGEVRENEGRLREALSYYDQALELNRGFVNGLVARAGLKLKLSDNRGATQDLAAALAIEPNNAEAQRLLRSTRRR